MTTSARYTISSFYPGQDVAIVTTHARGETIARGRVARVSGQRIYLDSGEAFGPRLRRVRFRATGSSKPLEESLEPWGPDIERRIAEAAARKRHWALSKALAAAQWDSMTTEELQAVYDALDARGLVRPLRVK